MIDLTSSYTIVTALSVVVILSYFFNLISKRTNVPSVLMLIATGILVNELLGVSELVDESSLFQVLEILGIIGLIMIVLEAALDLKLTRDKAPIIFRSFLVAFVGLFSTAAVITVVLRFFLDASWQQVAFYAIPISILSSAIVIPSINGLSHDKKEFLIYESTFSDILGIMLFYLMIEVLKAESNTDLLVSFGWNIGATIVISFVLSYALVWLFQHIQTQVKLFLLIAVLVVLYAIGKMLHLSSLMIILAFGIILNNREVFFRGPMSRWIKPRAMRKILQEFRIITIETAFIVRTYFFVVFGASIVLASLFNIRVFLESMVILAAIYLLRWLWFRLAVGKDIRPEVYIAPRGLITILLFYAIPFEYQIPEFDRGALLYVILITSLVMMWGLIAQRKRDLFDDLIEESLETPSQTTIPPTPADHESDR